MLKWWMLHLQHLRKKAGWLGLNSKGAARAFS
jgi:hypothetical protein